MDLLKDRVRPIGPRRMVSLVALIGFLVTPPIKALGQSALDYDIKAVFLYNFAQFVEWPATAFSNAASPIVIGVVGADPFGKKLDEVVRNETLQRRKLIVQRFRRGDAIQHCHVLFISQSEKERVSDLLNSLRGKPILTVSEIDEFASSGGMVCFVSESNRVRLNINPGSAKAANLTISSKLLRAANRIVETGAK